MPNRKKKTDEHMKTEEMLGLAAVLAGNTDIYVLLYGMSDERVYIFPRCKIARRALGTGIE